MSESTNSTPVFKEEYQKQIADIYKQYQKTLCSSIGGNGK